MPDRITPQQRSRNMARVRNKDTAPEVVIRKMLHRLGYRFRLHRRDLPGTPDIVLPRHKKVIFVHGCFWHNHDCPRGKRPATRRDFWNAKLDANVERDQSDQKQLAALGWEVLVVWGCWLSNVESLEKRLTDFMES